MPFRRLFLLGFSLLAFVLPHTVKADGDEYAFILGGRNNPYWTVLADGVRQAAKDKGLNAIVYEGENDTDAEAQLNTCETAIQRHPKLIAMEAMNSAIGLECFRQAKAAGILVGDIDHHLTIEETAKAGIPLAFTVGSDNTQIGMTAAKFAASVAGKPNPKILVIEGAPGSIPGEKRADGFRAGIKEALPSALVVASISAEWDRLKAMSITTDLLQRQPDIDIVYAVNDVMALGAAEAVHASSSAASVKVIGVDGTADARKAIDEGRMTATVAQLPYLIGVKSVDLAFDAVHGKAPGQIEVTPTPVLTRGMQPNSDPALQYVR